MYNPEINEIRRRFNVLREQYQKLQGSMKILQATTEELQTSLKKAEKERDEYKDAFDKLFTENIGDEWEHLPDEQKKKMNLDAKRSFFETEINMSKLYVRRQMTEQMSDTLKKNKELQEEIVSLKAQLTDKNEQLKNAITTGGIPAHNVSNSLLGQDEEGISGVKTAPTHHNAGTKKNLGKKPGLMNAIRNAFGAPSTEEETPKPPKHVEVKKEEPTPAPVPEPEPISAPIPEPPKPEPVVAEPAPSVEPPAPPKAEEKVESPQPHKPIEVPTTNGNLPTTGFFARFRKGSPEQQEAYKRAIPAVNALLDRIPLGKEVLLTMGLSGVYTVSDIQQKGIELGYWGDSSGEQKRVRRAIEKMDEENSKERVAAFLVRGNNEQAVGKGRQAVVYLMNQAAEAWYALTTMKDPVLSLSIVRAKEQKSVNHAELIQKMIGILKNAGYETFQEISLPTKTTGEFSIADISANKGDAYNIRIECEMGNYDEPSYIFKFKKALEVSDRLLVGVPTIVVKTKIVEAIKEMIRLNFAGIDDFTQQGFSFKVFTLEELSRNPDLILPDKKYRR